MLPSPSVPACGPASPADYPLTGAPVSRLDGLVKVNRPGFTGDVFS